MVNHKACECRTALIANTVSIQCRAFSSKVRLVSNNNVARWTPLTSAVDMIRSSGMMVGDEDRTRLGSRSKSRKKAAGGSCNWGNRLFCDEMVVDVCGDGGGISSLYNLDTESKVYISKHT